MSQQAPVGEYLAGLNEAQRAAVLHGADADGGLAQAPALLIVAGAGSGKTQTLAHRTAHLILSGVAPDRILLLTFTRRAAAEMTRRARQICAGALASGSSSGAQTRSTARTASARITWSGTFHGIANRLLRMYAEPVGLDPSFTVLDRGDAADLLDLIRHELDLSTRGSRFPQKATCLAIYSHVVNAQHPLERTLERSFPWCEMWVDELRKLFAAYVEEKQKRCVLDYDDLLLYWYHLMSEPALAGLVRQRFDCVLVDEYQDTNALQAAILLGLKPDGRGLSVVGDDAQSIYSFRAATVRNILDFPSLFDPPARVVTLEQNYRSTRPILAASNAVISLASEGYAKELFSERSSREAPQLVVVEDEAEQVECVVDHILAHREAGIELRRQAVLMRTSHHSDALEVELGRRNLPFHKYGGLKFLEAAHVKDVLCVLRWAENPRDPIAAFRVLQLMPGVGPAIARRAYTQLERDDYSFESLRRFRAPASAAEIWPQLCTLLSRLHAAATDWKGQIGMVRRWYEPQLERLHSAAQLRAGDLEQLEQISGTYPSRERFLTELTLDPTELSGDEAGPPHLDEDYLILSTIHSAKGQEWDVVYILNAVDGCIPSDMATGSPEEIEEERRLLYVAMTRARDHLVLIHPMRFFVRQQHRHGDRHMYAPRSRFLPDSVLDCFDRQAYGRAQPDDGPEEVAARVDVGARLREMWR